MAVAISVASLQNPAALRQRVTEEVNHLRQQGLEVSVCEIERGQLTFLGCNIEQSQAAVSPEQAEVLLRGFLAKALADIIITHCEGNLVRKWVQEEYRRFSAEERQKIIDLVLQNNNQRSWALSDRHARIVGKLVDYLNCSNTIILEGFVRFRLRDYQSELKEAVGRAADDVEGEKEYQEFIQLLRYFVSLQDSEWPTIQVLPEAAGGFRLLDEKSQPLTLSNLWDSLGSYEDLTHGDLLISTLVCMSPATIVLHIGATSDMLTQELVATIRDIFPGRVSSCPGCGLCQQKT